MGRSFQMSGSLSFDRPRMSAGDVARIGASLYQGVEYNGRPSWQGWLADGLVVDVATVRRWLMESAPSRRSVPEPIAVLLWSAEHVSNELCLWEQPRGTPIARRMAELVSKV